MPAPGVTVISKTGAASSLPSNSTGVAFIAGQAERGPTDAPVLIRNLETFKSTFGQRVSYGYLFDAVDIGIKEGLSHIYVSRAVGPAAVIATGDISDGAAGVAIVITAKNPGDWGNSIKVTTSIPDSGQLRAVVEYPVGTVVETSPIVTSKQALIDWSALSSWITITSGAGGNITATNVTLSTGADDRSNITTTQITAALTRFAKDLGPGQVAYPGGTTDEIHDALADHAEVNNRVYLADCADTATVATLTASAAANRALMNGHLGGFFAPWAIVDGLTPGTARTVPYSIIEMGMMARLDGETGNPNEPAAGVNGVSAAARGLSQNAWTDAERETLNEGGVNVARVMNGRVRTYGYRTPADAFANASHVNLNNERLEMAIRHGARVVGERYNFRQIDGKGHLLGDFAGSLAGEVLLPLYEVGAIFGDSPAEAFTVDTGGQVNPVEQLAAREVVAVITYKASPFAEHITIEITKEDLS